MKKWTNPRLPSPMPPTLKQVMELIHCMEKITEPTLGEAIRKQQEGKREARRYK